MGNAVAEGPDIKIHNPALFPTTLSRHGQCVLDGTPETVTVTVRMLDPLEFLFQQHRCCGLRYPMGHVWHPSKRALLHDPIAVPSHELLPD